MEAHNAALSEPDDSAERWDAALVRRRRPPPGGALCRVPFAACRGRHATTCEAVRARSLLSAPVQNFCIAFINARKHCDDEHAQPDGQFWLGATNVPELVVPLLADPGPGPSGKNQEICCATFAL